jgi:IclR family acetate operon transcriptional repressor
LEKNLAVLEALSHTDGPHRLADIATSAAVGKASVHRILQELVSSGFATSPMTGYYAPGLRLLGLASMVVGEETRTRSVGSVLEALRAKTGHTVHFAVLSDTEAVYVHKINADRAYEMASRVGMRIPLYCTAVGKCILAWLEPEALADVWGKLKPVARTPNTFTTLPELTSELAVIRKQGFSIDEEENEFSVICVGAPVFDQRRRVVGGVSVSALVFQMSLQDARALAPEVIAAAHQVALLVAPPAPSHTRSAHLDAL